MWYNARAMPLQPLITQLLGVAAQAAVLYVLSRWLFSWAMQSFAVNGRGPRGSCLFLALRAPGNLVHEVSHAVGFLLGGYTVRRLVPVVFDKQGRGSCQPGRAWSPVALPWLATGLAALLPLILGSLALRYVAALLGVHLHSEPVAGAGVTATLLGNLRAFLLQLDLGTWPGRASALVFLYLAFSICAELAPSDVDLRRSLPALLAATAGVALLLLACSRAPLQAPARVWVFTSLGHGLAWLSALIEFGIVSTAVVGAVSTVPAIIMRVLAADRKR